MKETEETNQSQIVPMPSLKAAMKKADKALPPNSLLAKLLSKEKSAAAIDWPEKWKVEQLLSCLTKPPHITISSFSLDYASYQFLFPWKEQEGLCLYSHSGDSKHLVAPVQSAGIASLLAEDFDPVMAPPPVELQFEFDRQSFTAFAAIIDFCRYIYTVSMMERIEVPFHQFSLAQLNEQLALSKGKSDFRWLLSHWPHFYPDAGSPKKADMKAGCKLLIKQGLIVKGDDGDDIYILSHALLVLASQFIMLSNTALIVSKDTSKTVFFNAATLWRADFLENSVKMRSIDGLELITGVREIISGVEPNLAQNNADESNDEDKIFCGDCGSQISSGRKFCTNCGSKHPT